MSVQKNINAIVQHIRQLEAKQKDLLDLLRECDNVARRRGDKWGLCDAIDSTGEPYQSAYLAETLGEQAKESGNA